MDRNRKVGVMNWQHVELDEEGSPLVDGFESLLVGIPLGISFYVGTIALGLYFHHVLMQSPLVKYVSMILAFVASCISWFFAFLSSGIIFGNFDFPKEVFNLISNHDYRIAIGFTFLLLPVEAIFARIVNRTASGNFMTVTVFIAITMIFVSMTYLANYLEDFKNYYAYVFSLSVIGLMFLAIFPKR